MIELAKHCIGFLLLCISLVVFLASLSLHKEAVSCLLDREPFEGLICFAIGLSFDVVSFFVFIGGYTLMGFSV